MSYRFNSTKPAESYEIDAINARAAGDRLAELTALNGVYRQKMNNSHMFEGSPKWLELMQRVVDLSFEFLEGDRIHE